MSEILAVKENMINYSSSTPIPKIYFDALTGGYILTKEVRKIPRDLFMNLLMIFPFDIISRKFEDIRRLNYHNEIIESLDNGILKQQFCPDISLIILEKVYEIRIDELESYENIKIITKKIDKGGFEIIYYRFLENTIENYLLGNRDEWFSQKENFTGHDLFSFLLPFDFTYDNGGVTIEQGVLMKGILSDKCLGQKPNSIIVYLNKNYSSKVALDFVTNYQKVMNDWLTETGFSVGLGDCIQDMKGLEEIISTSIIKADSRGKKEQQVKDSLDNAFNVSSKLAKENANKNNALMSMIMSGAKGKLDNLCQITAIVGRQDKDGHLITEGFTDRTLPCYRRRKTEEKVGFEQKRTLGDIHLKAESQGFISNSFMTGLNPREFWFHASSGRDGVDLAQVEAKALASLTPFGRGQHCQIAGTPLEPLLPSRHIR